MAASTSQTMQNKILVLEERLSKMVVARITMEDDYQQRFKQEQERADEFRSRYESVKQHMKVLEMQKGEYTKVNAQLTQQNNEFRGMITQLQTQLKKQTKVNVQLTQQNDEFRGIITQLQTQLKISVLQLQ
eukprot:527834_1